MHQAVGFASFTYFYNTYIRCGQKPSEADSEEENSGDYCSGCDGDSECSHNHVHSVEGHSHEQITIAADQFYGFFAQDVSKLSLIMVLGGMGPGMMMDSADQLDSRWNKVIFSLLCCSVLYEFMQGTFEGSLHNAGFYKSLLYGLGHAADELSPALVRGFQIFLSEQIGAGKVGFSV